MTFPYSYPAKIGIWGLQVEWLTTHIGDYEVDWTYVTSNGLFFFKEEKYKTAFIIRWV